MMETQTMHKLVDHRGDNLEYCVLIYACGNVSSNACLLSNYPNIKNIWEPAALQYEI